MKKIFLAGFILAAIILFASAFFVKKTEKKPNIILLSLDLLQKQHVSGYGYSKKTTPNLDLFFSHAYVFTNAITPASWTLPSTMSVFTSLYPSRHKIVGNYLKFEDKDYIAKKSNLKITAPETKTLPQILKQYGYATAGFTGGASLKSGFGFGMGFNEYYDKKNLAGFSEIFSLADNWLSKQKNIPFFLFLQGYDLHDRFDDPPNGYDYSFVDFPYRGTFKGTKQEQAEISAGNMLIAKEDIRFWKAVYDEKIFRLDNLVGSFFDQLKQKNLYEESLIIIFNSHGTEFFEHGRLGHGHTLYSELVDAVFAVKLPYQKTGKKIEDLVSTMDIAPTILGLIGIEEPYRFDGINLTKAMNDNANISRAQFFETDHRNYLHKRGIQTPDGWKFIFDLNNFGNELYYIKDDPAEQRNLIVQESKKAYELQQQLRIHMKQIKDTGPWIFCTQEKACFY